MADSDNTLYSYVLKRLIDTHGELTAHGQSILRAYERVSRLPLRPYFSLCRKSKWIIIGGRIYSQVSRDIKKNSHLVMTARDVKRCRSFPRSWSYDLKAYLNLYNYITSKDVTQYSDYEKRIIKIIKKTEAKVIVANSTMDPINRIWLNTGRMLNMQTICIQHGVYSSTVPKYILEDNIVDSYVALDDWQCNIVSKNIPRHKIITQGVRKFFYWDKPQETLKICFVGEDWERYGALDQKKIILKTYSYIAAFLNNVGRYDFYYKPHPSEQEFGNVKEFCEFIGTGRLKEMNVFIGFSSTLLKEMSSLGMLALQIVDKTFECDDFEEMGYCLSIKRDELLGERIIEKIKNSQIVPMIENKNISEIIAGLY